MSKRKIFDIEKIGFGDEVSVKKIKPTPQTEEKKKPLTQQIPTNAKGDVTSKIGITPQVETLPIQEPVKKVQAKLEEKNKPKPKKVTKTFRSNEFVSPIYGVMEDRSLLSKLVKGNYKLSTVNSLKVTSNISDVSYKKDIIMNTTKEEVQPHLTDISNIKIDIADQTANIFDFDVEIETLDTDIFEVDSTDGNLFGENIFATPIEKAEPIASNEPIVSVNNDTQEISKMLEDTAVLIKETELRETAEKDEEEQPFYQEESSHSDEFESDFFEAVVAKEVVNNQSQTYYYEMPPLSLLADPKNEELNDDDWIIEKMDTLHHTFVEFGVKVNVTGDYTQGPTVTQIEIQPEAGTKISKILNLQNDLKLKLAVEELRIEAPIPGKNTIGVEIPNRRRKPVVLKEILSKPEFMLHDSPLYIGLGQDICGEPVYTNILTMPHGLIAGQTGSGKSVCINTLLISILYKASPEDVRIMLVDPKRVELAPYTKIPHLVTPVITDEKKAETGLKWAVEEMERRYELFSQNGVRDIKSFNDRRLEFEMDYEKLPYILIIIDELADLMMVSPQEVENHIMRITQKARACGIHLIVATQRPTVDVVTGTIKSNIPSRIAFAVAQGNDSKVILDEVGAQNLLGAGDMLISQSGTKVRRVQGAYVSEKEIDTVVDFVKKQAKPNYLIEDNVFEKGSNGMMTDSDPLLNDVIEFIIERGQASTSALQRRFSIGFNRAGRMMDTLEMKGFISKPLLNSSKPREVLITSSEYEAYLEDETRY
ncbi:MAG: DNA translocase FtsK [Turicibacter sp.]